MLLSQEMVFPSSWWEAYVKNKEKIEYVKVTTKWIENYCDLYWLSCDSIQHFPVYRNYGLFGYFSV